MSQTDRLRTRAIAPPGSSRNLLIERQRLPTSGARTVLPYMLEGAQYLAVTQFAADIPGQPPSMHGGNSDTDMPIYRWRDGRFEEDTRLGVPGGEDAEFFQIGTESFLATTTARTGSGTYESNTLSKIFRWQRGVWAEFQSVPGLVAKQWRHFSFDGRHFLALALGITGDTVDARHPRRSCILEWNGSRFVEFQILDGRWGYNWAYFELDGQRLLGYADHVDGSVIYRWNGERFELLQLLAERGGRAFKFFEADGRGYLAFANILSDSALCRWNGRKFERHQLLPGAGGREFALITAAHGMYLVRINFIEGTPALPKTDLLSQIYRWENGRLQLVQDFATNGGTDAEAFVHGNKTFLVVSNSLSPQLRFREDTVVYEFSA